MTTHIIDLRGKVGGQTPELTLGENWKSKTPKAGRFGLHSTLQYIFREGTPLVVANGDTLKGILQVPLSEVWELFSIRQRLLAVSGAGIYSNIQTSYMPAGAQWRILADDWLPSTLPGVPLTRPMFFSGTDQWVVRDEASETDPNSGLRKRMLYAGTVLVAEMAHGASVTITEWEIEFDMVRYPSTAKLRDMLEAGDVTQNELFAALALRFPSPAEAF